MTQESAGFGEARLTERQPPAAPPGAAQDRVSHTSRRVRVSRASGDASAGRATVLRYPWPGPGAAGAACCQTVCPARPEPDVTTEAAAAASESLPLMMVLSGRRGRRNELCCRAEQYIRHCHGTIRVTVRQRRPGVTGQEPDTPLGGRPGGARLTARSSSPAHRRGPGPGSQDSAGPQSMPGCRVPRAEPDRLPEPDSDAS